MRTRRRSVVQFISIVLSGALVFAPLRGVASGGVASPEGFLLSEQLPSLGQANAVGVKTSGAQGRQAPVSSSGAYQDGIGIDVPPGRLGMTPRLSLSYSSDAAKRQSPVGAGWSFEVPSIQRSTRQGFPPLTVGGSAIGSVTDELLDVVMGVQLALSLFELTAEIFNVLLAHRVELEGAMATAPVAPPPGMVTLDQVALLALSQELAVSLADSLVAQPVSFEAALLERLRLVIGSIIGARLSFAPVYDDERGEFEGRDGVLVPTEEGPSTATGALYAPVREHRAVRYEYRTGSGSCAGGFWIEHDPSGMKRYYGCDATGQRSAQITTELGTAEWLLVAEEDPHGNSIEYSYHNTSGLRGQARANRFEPQDRPILATVQWGGNARANVAHPFRVTTSISSQLGGVDALRGHVLLNHKVDTIQVLGPRGLPEWTYDLVYAASPDSGNLLLSEVRRREGLL